MAEVQREYTMTLTIKVTALEEENEFDHSWLNEALHELFPRYQEFTIGGNVQTEITHRQLTRDY